MTVGSGEQNPVDQSKKPKRKLSPLQKIGAIAAIATAGVSAVAIGVSELKGNDSEQQINQGYIAYDFHEDDGINNWDEKLHASLAVGAEIQVTDITIRIPNGATIQARYSPTVIPTRDTQPGNMALLFDQPGTEITIDNAVIINGDYENLSDKSSNRWAWINGKSMGLDHDIFINLGRENTSFITSKKNETGLIRNIDQSGHAIVIDNGEVVGNAPGDIIIKSPTPYG
ncbi:MAG: hypothetical protein AABX29_03015 [Nanoarchaeota archaeon]